MGLPVDVFFVDVCGFSGLMSAIGFCLRPMDVVMSST